MRMVIKNFYKGVIAFVLAGALAAGWYVCYDSMPSQVRLIAEREQQMNFRVPASASIETDQGRMETGLYRPVTMVAGASEATYQMDVKWLGLIPLKSVEIQVMGEREVSAAGLPIGIFLKTKGVMVVGVGSFNDINGAVREPAKNHLEEGDYIVSYNGEEITGKQQFMSLLSENQGTEVLLGIDRDGAYLEERIAPAQNQNGEYKMGIWIRDNAQGIGTLTYVDTDETFGALGHGINDVDTSTLMLLEEGALYKTEIIGITRGEDGSPGELTGYIEYENENIIGEITENTAEGIFGVCKEEIVQQTSFAPIPIALKQEVVIGPAQIICSVTGEPQYYDIVIEELHLEEGNINRGLVIKITDEELLALTGGIIQGMSGSPIIQNGKLVGAVTHVLVQDSASGYGIFIENMLVQ